MGTFKEELLRREEVDAFGVGRCVRREFADVRFARI